MSKSQIALNAINTLTEFDISTEEKQAIQEMLPYFEVAYELVYLLDDLLNPHLHTKNTGKIAKLLKQAKQETDAN